jgi:glycerol-3-phosphate acyltransferase PlsX
MEGTVSVVTGFLRESLHSSLRAKIGGFLVRPALERMRARVDYAEYGGVPVLGVDGVLINCHGRSKARAIVQGIRLADRMARADLAGAIRRELVKPGSPADDASVTLLTD